MTTIAADAEKLRELDRDTRRAWSDYRDKTRTLVGVDYEDAELDAWTDLQVELRRLDQRRNLMKAGADADR